jgi:hypothetical protein
MANTIKIKRSAVAGKAPVVGDLDLGELALNTYDGKLYTKKDDGTASIVELSGGGGGVTSVTATSPLASTGGNTPDISIQDGTTAQKGAVQLEDSTSSTSTTKAATPASVKSAYDLAAAALPKAGGTLTGDVTLNAQSDLRFADADSSNWVAFQAPATVASNVTWTLPAADGTANQVLSTNGSGTLSWATSGGGAISKISQGNTEAEVVDTGSDGHFKVTTEGTERLRIAGNGAWGLAGANYGSSAQILTSNGSGSPPSWQAAPSPAALSTASGSAPSYSARAWVNFNGTGTVAIRASGNVSSITDNGPGEYTVNFTTALANANYSIVATGGSSTGFFCAHTKGSSVATTGGASIVIKNQSNTAVDSEHTSVAIFR